MNKSTLVLQFIYFILLQLQRYRIRLERTTKSTIAKQSESIQRICRIRVPEAV